MNSAPRTGGCGLANRDHCVTSKYIENGCRVAQLVERFQ